MLIRLAESWNVTMENGFKELILFIFFASSSEIRAFNQQDAKGWEPSMESEPWNSTCMTREHKLYQVHLVGPVASSQQPATVAVDTLSWC